MFEKNVLARCLYNYGFDVYAFYAIKKRHNHKIATQWLVRHQGFEPWAP